MYFIKLGSISIKDKLGLGLWCLTSLSTIFQYMVAVIFIGKGNRNTRLNHRPAASHLQPSSHNVVASTPLHEQYSNSQPQY